MKYFIILAVIIFYICINDLFAQYRLQNHVDIGKTKISNGLYFSNSTYFDYSYNETTFKIGARVDLIDRTTFNRFFSGLDILVNQKIPLKKWNYTSQFSISCIFTLNGLLKIMVRFSEH